MYVLHSWWESISSVRELLWIGNEGVLQPYADDDVWFAFRNYLTLGLQSHIITNVYRTLIKRCWRMSIWAVFSWLYITFVSLTCVLGTVSKSESREFAVDLRIIWKQGQKFRFNSSVAGSPRLLMTAQDRSVDYPINIWCIDSFVWREWRSTLVETVISSEGTLEWFMLWMWLYFLAFFPGWSEVVLFSTTVLYLKKTIAYLLYSLIVINLRLLRFKQLYEDQTLTDKILQIYSKMFRPKRNRIWRW